MSWLRFCSSNFSVTSTLFFWPGVFSTLGLSGVFFDRLEVPELIDALDAELQRLAVEDAVLEQPELAADDVVARGGVADEGDAVDEVLLALLQAHRHVDDRRLLLGRFDRLRIVGLRRIRHVPRLQIRVAGELPVAAGAIELARHLHALPDLLLAVVVALVHFEQLPQHFGLDHRVAVEREAADAIAIALGDRHLQLDVAGLPVLGVVEDLDLGRADARGDVALVAVVLGDPLGVFLELGFLIGAAPGDPGEPVLGLVLLHLLFKRAVAEGLVAVEVEPLDLDLRAFLDVERQMDQLRSAWQLLDCVGDLGVLIALLGHQAADDALDAPDQPGIDERVETDLEVLFLQLVVDLRLLDLLAALVVDDLDALALLHLVDDALARPRRWDRDRRRLRPTGPRGSWWPRDAGSPRRRIFSVFSSYGTQTPSDGRLTCAWM